MHQVRVLVLLNLNAACDTVNHDIMNNQTGKLGRTFWYCAQVVQIILTVHDRN